MTHYPMCLRGSSGYKTGVILKTAVSASLALGAYGLYKLQKLPTLNEDKEEMIRWSSSLSDPDNPNFNPFLLRPK